MSNKYHLIVNIGDLVKKAKNTNNPPSGNAQVIREYERETPDSILGYTGEEEHYRDKDRIFLICSPRQEDEVIESIQKVSKNLSYFDGSTTLVHEGCYPHRLKPFSFSNRDSSLLNNYAGFLTVILHDPKGIDEIKNSLQLDIDHTPIMSELTDIIQTKLYENDNDGELSHETLFRVGSDMYFEYKKDDPLLSHTGAILLQILASRLGSIGMTRGPPKNRRERTKEEEMMYRKVKNFLEK